MNLFFQKKDPVVSSIGCTICQKVEIGEFFACFGLIDWQANLVANESRNSIEKVHFHPIRPSGSEGFH